MAVDEWWLSNRDIYVKSLDSVNITAGEGVLQGELGCQDKTVLDYLNPKSSVLLRTEGREQEKGHVKVEIGVGVMQPQI